MKQRKIIYGILGGVCAAIIIAALYLYFFSSMNKSEEPVYVYIDEDDNCDSIYKQIEPLADKRAMTGLRTMIRQSEYGSKIRTGRYKIEPGDGPITVFSNLKRGQQAPVMLTVPSVRTLDDLAGVIGKKLMKDSTDFAEAFHNDSVIKSLGYDSTTIACLIIPNTYEMYWNISVPKFISRMKKEHDKFWNAARTAKAEAAGLTPNEVTTLASIVDEETNNNAEKPMVAGMYINRLKQDMPLQADPTVKFALGDFAKRRIYLKDLSINSPYNTYINTGLPPGPIRIPTQAGIDAVLNHVQHEYLYMCAKEDFSGTHNFAKTYKEHLENAAKYSKALNERNIK